jgi:hypothetical protein
MRRACTIAALVAIAATVEANVIIPTEFRQVVAASTLIVRGHVTDVRPIVVKDARTDTAVTVLADATLKGEPARFVTVRVPGGDDGRFRWVVPGAPSFHVGESAVFFLSRGSDNVVRLVGLSLGVYRLRADKRTRRTYVDPPAVMGPTASAGPIVLGDPRRRPMPVEEFESLVQLVLTAQRGPKGIAR